MKEISLFFFGDENGSLFNVGKNAALTLVNMEISIGGDGRQGNVVGTNDGAVVIKSTKGTGINARGMVAVNNGSLEIQVGTFHVASYVVSESSGSIEVMDGTFISEDYGFYEIKGKLVIHHADMKSYDNCIYIWKGDVEIHGGTYLSSDDECIDNNYGTVTLYPDSSFEGSDDEDSCLYSYEGTYIIAEDASIWPEDWQHARKLEIRGKTPEPESGKGSFTISKTVEGTGLPDADTSFEFRITKDGNPATGGYSVDDGDASPIPQDGRISLKAGQSAILTGLTPGDYLVSETAPDQPNYQSTSFSVNGGEMQTGCSATVSITNTSVAATGGWKKEDGRLVQDDDGYFIYTITPDQISEDRTITVDCDLLAEYFISKMQDNQNSSPCNFKVKFINETGGPIQYKDYHFDTVNWMPAGYKFASLGNPSMKDTDEGTDEYSAGYGWGKVWQQMYAMLTGQTNTAGSLNVTGFDGNPVRIASAPLRTINPAVISYFSSNPGKGTLTGNAGTGSASEITLKQMNAFPELIKKAFTFKNWKGEEISLPADPARTYADFLCAFYEVNSLDNLTAAQKYNVLGTGSKGSPAMPYNGQSHITTWYSNRAGTISNWCIPYTALNDGTLNNFKTWGFSDTRIAAGKKLRSGSQEFSAEGAKMYAYQPDYYLLESDPEVIRMAYQYLYERCIRFSLDSKDRPVPTAIDNSASVSDEVSGLKDYLDQTESASANVLAAMNDGAKIPDGESLTLNRIKGYIEVPNAWNQFRYYDFGFQLTFQTNAAPVHASSVTFTNIYKEKETPETPENPGTPETLKTGTSETVQVGEEPAIPDNLSPTPAAESAGPATPLANHSVPSKTPGTPATGDESDSGLYCILLIGSSMALLAVDLLFWKKRRRDRNR